MLTVAGITSDLFNASSRHIIAKATFYFSGLTTVFTQADYLQSFEMVEECLPEGDTLSGSIISNMLTVKLAAADKRFNAKNPASPFYGKIVKGVKIKLEIQTVATGVTTWVPMGIYYIQDWQTDALGINATITAMDIMNKMFDQKTDGLDVMTNRYISDYIGDVAGLTDCTIGDITVSEDYRLKYAYPMETWGQTLERLLNATLSAVVINRAEQFTVLPLLNNNSAVATFTDTTQIQSLATKQSLQKQYTNCLLNYAMVSLEEAAVVYSATGMDLPAGILETFIFVFTKLPVKDIDSITITIPNTAALTSYEVGDHTSRQVEVAVEHSDPSDVTAQIDIIGTCIKKDKRSTDVAPKQIEVTNEYILTNAHATWYKDKLDAFIAASNKFVTISARGNALVELGDKVEIESTRYATTITGLLIKAEYHYAGVLSADYTFIDTAYLEV